MFRLNFLIINILLTFFFVSNLFAQSATAIFEIADSLRAKEQYTKSIEWYKKASKSYELQAELEQYITTELEIILVYLEMDSLKQAILKSDKLVQKAEELLEPESETLAMVYHKKGVLYYTAYEDALAIIFFKKALEIREYNQNSKKEDLIRGNRNIGESYDFIGKADSAKFHLEAAFELLKKFPPKDKSLGLEVYQLLARVYQNYGDLAKAKEFIGYILESYEQLPSENEEKLLQAIALGDYGTVLRDLYQFDEAIGVFKTSISLLRTIPNKETAIADVLNNLGTCYYQMENYTKSKKAIEESLKINISKERNLSIQTNYINLSLIKIKEQKYAEALNILKNKIAIDFLDNKRLIAIVNDNLGDAYRGLKQPILSIKYYNLSLTGKLKDYTTSNVKEFPVLADFDLSQKGILNTLFSKAKSHQLIYEIEDNLEELINCYLTYEKIDSLVSMKTQSFLAENSKLSLVKVTKPIYEKAIEISLKLYEFSKDEKYKNAAFDFIQKSKAITLSEAVRHTQSTSFLDVDLSKEKYLNIDISRLTEKSYSTDGISVEEQEQLINLKNEKEKFVKYLEQNNPAYFNYKYNEKTVAREELINLLEEETTLMEFFVGDSTCFVATYISDQQLNIYEIPISRKKLSGLVSNFTEAIYNPFIANENINKISLSEADANYANIGYELYRLLLEPLKVKTNKLLIIPDDILNTLPFDALLTQKVPEESVGYYGNKADYNFLLYKHEIGYNYGVSLMKQARIKKYAPMKNQLAVYGTPDFINQVTELKEVFGDWDEFFKIMNKKGVNQSFQETSNNYKYIHLSAHGILNNEDANQSYFNMSTAEDDFKPLYLSTLYTIQINAEMVVTSACDAGIGKVSKGEGILSMARGFFYAGAKSVITSLWEVKDGFTGKLLKNFYQNLKDGKDKRKALNQAKQNFIRTQGDDFARPYYWAAFVPIGKMESVEIPYLLPFNVKIVLGFIMSFLIIGSSKFLINNNQSPSTV